MRALVTGGAGGIGSAIADALEAAGHTAFRHDIRPAENVHLVGDLQDQDHLDQLRTFGRDEGIDCVIAAHGIAAALRLDLIDRPYLERAMRINTLSFLDLYDALEECLVEHDGVFLGISSQAGLVGEPSSAAYCASKFAVVGWAQALAEVDRGPRIRILCPGATETPLLRDAFEGMASSQGVAYEQILAAREGKIPAGRLGRTTDLGAAALWLTEISEPRVLIAPVTGGEVLV